MAISIKKSLLALLFALVYEHTDEIAVETCYFSDLITVKEIVKWSSKTGEIIFEKEYAENGDVIYFYERTPDGEDVTHRIEADDHDCATERRCADCDFVFVPAREHTYENGYCKHCGKAAE